MNGEPMYRWTVSDVLAAVVDVEMAVFLGPGPTKDQALLALAARRELEDRMRRHRWLAMETARKVGASWAEIATASGMSAADARRLYEATLAGQKAFGYAQAHPADPGFPELWPMSDGAHERVIANTRLHRPTLSRSGTRISSSTARPSMASSFSSSSHLLSNPRQTPLHRGCRGWASPAVAGVR